MTLFMLVLVPVLGIQLEMLELGNVSKYRTHHREYLTPADLRPITRVMYASALIPGGKLSQTILYDEWIAACMDPKQQ
jgi:hypothetical protein